MQPNSRYNIAFQENCQFLLQKVFKIDKQSDHNNDSSVRKNRISARKTYGLET
jgi:hypothetical protein